jgi:Tfp pilus assembly protein PilN
MKKSTTSFLPEDYLRRKRENKGLIVNLALFAVMIGLVGSAFVVSNRQWSSVKAEHATAVAEYSAEAVKIDQLKAMEAKRQELLYRAEVTTALIERVPRSILMAEIVNRMPKGTTLTDLVMESTRVAPPAPKKTEEASSKSLTGGGASKDEVKAVVRPVPPTLEFRLTIAGLAASDTDVADFQTALKDCVLLDRVELASTMEHQDGERSMRKFRIEASIRADADTSAMQPLVKERDGASPVAVESAKPEVKKGAVAEASTPSARRVPAKPAAAKGDDPWESILEKPAGGRTDAGSSGSGGN